MTLHAFQLVLGDILLFFLGEGHTILRLGRNIHESLSPYTLAVDPALEQVCLGP